MAATLWWAQVNDEFAEAILWICRATGLQWKMSRVCAKWKDAFWIEMEPEDPTPLTKIAGTI